MYGLETPADAAQLCIDAGRLFAIDVNDNFRGWDDDMVVGSVHLVETFEFFYTLRKNNWDGVWQLDQFPFREDSVEAAKVAIRFLKALHGALDALDVEGLRAAQASHDALTAQRPKTRYVVGCDARIRATIERLPDRLRDRLYRRALLGE